MRNLEPEPAPFTIIPDEPDLSAPSLLEPKNEVVYVSPEEPPYLEQSEQDAISGDEPAVPETLSGRSEEPVLPEDRSDASEPHEIPTTLGEPIQEVIEWPVIQKAEPAIAEAPSIGPGSSGDTFRKIEEPVLPEDQSDASESHEIPTTLGEPIQEVIEWPVIQKAEPALVDTWPAEKRSSGNVLGTADEPALSNYTSSEIAPSIQRSLTIALESLLPPQESDKVSEYQPPLPTIGENPVEDIENPPKISPVEQQFSVSSIERLEKNEGYSPSEIASQPAMTMISILNRILHTCNRFWLIYKRKQLLGNPHPSVFHRLTQLEDFQGRKQSSSPAILFFQF